MSGEPGLISKTRADEKSQLYSMWAFANCCLLSECLSMLASLQDLMRSVYEKEDCSHRYYEGLRNSYSTVYR